MLIKKIPIAITLSFFSTLAYALPYLDKKVPFVDNMNQIDDGGFNISIEMPYIAEAFKNDVIDRDMIFYSIEQQRALREWLDERQPKRFVLVDISSYKMYLVTSLDNTNRASDFFIEMETSVVVGNRYHRTPSTPIDIISLKYNPTWTPTLNIMRRNARKSDGSWNWEWIKQHDFTPHAHSTGQAITWEEAEELRLDEIYMVSPPSRNNALGLLKFETNSTQNIYLHDTNEPHFFERSNRARSSGCVRVENPFKFAGKLAYKDEQYIRDNIAKGRMYWERIENTPIYFHYDIIEYNIDGYDALQVTDDPYDYYKDYLSNNSSNYRLN